MPMFSECLNYIRQIPPEPLLRRIWLHRGQWQLMVDSLARLCRLGFRPQLFRLRPGIMLTRVSIQPACRLDPVEQLLREVRGGVGVLLRDGRDSGRR
nr:hypothetical protein Itr_chr04CG20310 [Ipomoea trifida]